MTTFITIISALWAIRIVFNIINFTHIWWVKEYRWDRMVVHLRTDQGKRIYFLPWKRPHVAPKSIAIILMTTLILGLGIMYGNVPILLKLFFADVVSLPLTFFSVGVLYIPTYIYHSVIISRARRMLHQRQATNLFVIGITGSFGKTSVKEYLASMLASRFSTLKTEASKNSPIGIAEVVISKLSAANKMFVVEMAAYKKGEIAYMSDLVRPQVGVVTAINEQHQDLFGSIENTMKAKYELVAHLTGKRIAIMNFDDSRVRVMGEWAKADGVTVWWYGRGNNLPESVFFRATGVKSDAHDLRFTCRYQKQTADISVHLIGEHHVSNILAAIAAGVSAGMTFHEACRAASRISPVKHVLEKHSGTSGFTLIDDTFNNNPDAARAALDVLSREHPKRIFVFQPMIELGSFASTAHRDVGKYAAKICDAIILTNNNWSKDFIEGVRTVSSSVPVKVLSGSDAATYIQEFASSGGTILGKGKEALRILKKLES